MKGVGALVWKWKDQESGSWRHSYSAAAHLDREAAGEGCLSAAVELPEDAISGLSVLRPETRISRSLQEKLLEVYTWSAGS